MLCPYCGSEDDKVVRTKVRKDGIIERKRSCKACKEGWKSYECYEVADAEVPIAIEEARQLVRRVQKWLRPVARNIPIVRDSIHLLKNVNQLLEDREQIAEDSGIETSDTA